MAGTPPRRTLTGAVPTPRRPQRSWQEYEDCFDDDGTIHCWCEDSPRAIKLTTATNKNGNLGRKFWRCRRKKNRACRFFVWDDELEEYGWPGYPDEDDDDHFLDDLDLDAPLAGPAPPAHHAPASTPPTSTDPTPKVTPAAHDHKKRPADEEPAFDSPDIKKPRVDAANNDPKDFKAEAEEVKHEEDVDKVKMEQALGLRRSKRVSVKPKRFAEDAWTE